MTHSIVKYRNGYLCSLKKNVTSPAVNPGLTVSSTSNHQGKNSDKLENTLNTQTMPASGFFMPSNPLSSSIPKIRQEGGFNSPQESQQQPQQHQQQSSVHSHSWRDFHSTFDISDTLDSLMQTDNSANQWMQVSFIAEKGEWM